MNNAAQENTGIIYLGLALLLLGAVVAIILSKLW